MRNSNFELLRLVSMFFIVLYHIFFFIIVKVDDDIIYKAMWLPLHVAVICFVLISGYFHINPSLRGIVKLIVPLIIFYLPLTLWEMTHSDGGVKGLLFFSKSPYWFIRTYLCLFLVAPILNEYLVSNKRRIYLLVVLGFISVYMGNLHEPSLNTGKNLVLFMFLYVLGDCLNVKKNFYIRYSFLQIFLVYLLLNTALVYGYMTNHSSFLGRVLWNLSYPYCSPFLIVNAVILFMLFSKMEFKSKYVNWLSSSVFAVYIIHHQHYILYSIIGPIAINIMKMTKNPLIVMSYLCILTMLILFVCVLIDKLFTPLWNYLIPLSNHLESRLYQYFVKSR